MDVVPDPRTFPVSTIDVVFSEPINNGTFTYQDLELRRDGNPVPLSPSVSISQVGAATYRIFNLEPFSASPGAYLLKVSASNIADTSGALGTGEASETWSMMNPGPTVLDVVDVRTDPRTTPVSSVNVVFSEPVDLTTFTWQDVTLTRDGVQVPLDATAMTALVSGDTYRINGLDLFTAPSGSYLLTVNGSGIANTEGALGTGEAFDIFSMTNPGPTVLDVVDAAPDPRTTPLSSVDVVFSESLNLTTFTWQDVTLTRNGVPVPLDATVMTALVSGDTYRINGLESFTIAGGAYELTVNASGIQDQFGSSGSGAASDAWSILSVNFGDAPDVAAGIGAGNYNTLSTDHGPSHTIVAGLQMGANVDGDGGVLQNAAANADDVNGALPDDEDGLVNPAADLALTMGAQTTINVRVTNTTGTAALLNGWIDYNADGEFDNAIERASVEVPNGTNNVIVNLDFSAVPSGFTGKTYARFRLSTDPAAGYATGAATDGEVEDYLVTITAPSSGTAESSKNQKIASGIGGGPSLANDDRFGSSLSALGDLDGDGVTDLAAGAIHDDTGGSDRGAVHVLFMNANGTVKSSQKIASGTGGGPTLANGGRFGVSVASLGDLDGDGMTDLTIGAYLDATGGTGRGAVYVLMMNANGTVKSSQKIASGTGGGPTLANGDRFGASVASLGDLDGDGVTDLAIGAYLDATGGTGRGAVYVLLMNANGTVKSSQKIASGTGGGPTLANDDNFGSSLAALGDLDGDGVTDVAAGAFGDDTDGSLRGAVHVLFMNANGTVKSSQKIASGTGGGPTLANGDRFGDSVARLGDLDGDGVTDLAVGASTDDTGGTGRGAVYVLMMNPNGTAKSSQKIASGTGGGPALANDDNFGTSLAALGDLDGDGVTDVAIGAYLDDTGGTDRGAVYVLFLKPAALVGDVNHDGLVNIFDVNLISAHWGESGPLGDANQDGIVDIFDVNLVSANWTTSGGGGGASGPGESEGPYAPAPAAAVDAGAAENPTEDNSAIESQPRLAADQGSPVPGDLNLDGLVEATGIEVVSANWNGAGPAGDANGDGVVNIFDVNWISSNWSIPTGSAASLSELRTAPVFAGEQIAPSIVAALASKLYRADTRVWWPTGDLLASAELTDPADVSQALGTNWRFDLLSNRARRDHSGRTMRGRCSLRRGRLRQHRLRKIARLIDVHALRSSGRATQSHGRTNHSPHPALSHRGERADGALTLPSPMRAEGSRIRGQRRGDDLQEAAAAFVPAVAGEAAPGQVEQKAHPAAVAGLQRRDHQAERQWRRMEQSQPRLRDLSPDGHQRRPDRHERIVAHRREHDQLRIRIARRRAALDQPPLGVHAREERPHVRGDLLDLARGRAV